jgi:hyperosmotically inducible periplasmic protein
MKVSKVDGPIATMANIEMEVLSMKICVYRMLFAATVVLGSVVCFAYQDTGSSSAPADNTKVNQRDRDPSSPTADQQKENRPDRELAAQIRKSLVKDKSLSTNAHNVKVIAQNGSVTLRGPVDSEQEKKAVEAKATQIAGADKVTSELQVGPK